MLNTYLILNRKCKSIIKIFLLNVFILLLFIIYGINTFYYQTSIQLHSEILFKNSLFYLEVLTPEKEVSTIVKNKYLQISNIHYEYKVKKINPNIIYQDNINYQKVYLEVKDLNKGFGDKTNRIEVLKNLSLNVEKGEFCVLLGPSGSGKSTLLNILGGIDYPDGGEVKINGEKMNSLNSKKLTMFRRNHLGYVFQMYNLIPDLTVRENIEVGAYLSKKPLNLDELIETLGLKEHQDKLPSQLSGGQQQRTSIGRAIIKNPDILLCDEPTGALDYNTSKEILKLIEKVNQKYGSTVIMVTHNDAIKYMADRVVRLRDGQILKNYLNDKKVKAEDLEW